MANALCSLLLGRSYNAYNVYGFAIQEVTERVMCRIESPFEATEEKVEETVVEDIVSKYKLKPPRDLRSKFLQAMEQKEIDKVKRELKKQEENRKREWEELKKPPPDELHGRRIHGWVLMLPHDEKDDNEPFFIEATTGMRRELDHPGYCSIQSVWNNTNYWVNLQDDSIGLKNLDYDLTNLKKWEHILPGEPIQGRVHEKNYNMEDEEEAEETRLIMDEKHLDMPEPWSLLINIPHEEVARRFTKGSKTTQYMKTIVEQYSPYLQEDGLIVKIYKYDDMEYTNLRNIEARFENRNDKLVKKTVDTETGLITEYFDRGRDDNAKIHYFNKYDDHLESWRKIEFYYKSRFDCLQLLDHASLSLTEHYVDREDKFYYRHIEYAKRGEPPPGFIEGPRRIIKNVLEKFMRDESKKASDDIAVREFDFIGRLINLKFHYDVGKITASTRTFLKPPLTEMVEGISFKPELTYGYHADLGGKPPKNSTLYSLLESQLKSEEDCNLKIRHVEDMIAEFLRVRAQERAQPKLDVGPFNREQNQDQRAAMLEKERFEKTKKEREIEEDLDFIQPYLLRLKCGPTLRMQEAIKVRDYCLLEFKDLLLKRASELQDKFQAQIRWLQRERQWYTMELDNLTHEDEQEHFTNLNNGIYTLHILELRLIRQAALSPERYSALEQYLELHPKLQILQKLKK